MNKCDNCGVRVEEGLDECPLCGEPVTEQRRQEREAAIERENILLPGAEVPPEDEETVRSAKIWMFEMVSLVAFTAGIIIFAADFASGFELDWSLYPLLGIGFVYLFTSALIGFARTPGILLIVQTAIVAGFLLLLDLLIADGGWFISLALPITVLVAVLTGASSIAISRLGLNALQGVAVVFLASGFGTVGLELIINLARDSETLVGWSLIAFACTLSVFVLVLFINKRLKERHSEFRKIFHL
ncbi:MAG: DUF6320 domain-containing protein [Spirochaetota bacterium]